MFHLAGMWQGQATEVRWEDDAFYAPPGFAEAVDELIADSWFFDWVTGQQGIWTGPEDSIVLQEPGEEMDRWASITLLGNPTVLEDDSEVGVEKGAWRRGDRKKRHKRRLVRHLKAKRGRWYR